MLPEVIMSISVGIMLVLWVAGFAAGYGLRSYMSYRRHKWARLSGNQLTGTHRTLTPLENVDPRELESVPWVRTSPPSMVE